MHVIFELGCFWDIVGHACAIKCEQMESVYAKGVASLQDHIIMMYRK